MNDVKRFEPLWGSWYVKELIGEGGYGKVYRIEREEFGAVYTSALKYIKIPKSQSEVKSIMSEGYTIEETESYFRDFAEQLVKEIQLMAKLKGNSNIVSYEDHKVIKTEGKPEWHILIRMELLTGLIDYLSENKITKRDVIKLGIDICRALETCRNYNIIHRDIKPENIFVSDQGNFKLGDFGIARELEKTAAGLSKKGTYTYMAPEVYKGEDYGPSVDIYSLGIVMYRFLNGNRTPFLPQYPARVSGADRERALVRRMSGEKPEKPVNADGKLAEIVLKACAYDPKDRYESPTEMRKELEALKACAYDPKDRYESPTEMRKELEALLSKKKEVKVNEPSKKPSNDIPKAAEKKKEPVPEKPSEKASANEPKKEETPNNTIDKKSGKMPLIAAGAAVVLAAVLVFTVFLKPEDISEDSSSVAYISEESSSEDSYETVGEDYKIKVTIDGITYKYEDNTLTISGNGEIPDSDKLGILNVVNEAVSEKYGEDNVHLYRDNPNETYSVKNVIIENGITRIGSGAFISFEYLNNIKISDSVTSIGASAFESCRSLTEIEIPDSVTTIESRAFAICKNLKKIEIPDSVTTIGEWAFRFCSSLTEVKLSNKITSIERYTFDECTSLTEIELPTGVTSIKSGAFSDCIGLTELTISDSVTSIGYSAFFSCDSLTELTIPDSVTSIGDSAFFSCDSLTELTIPDSVTSMDTLAFGCCNSLTEITILGSVHTIAESAFNGCSGLKTVNCVQGSAADNPALYGTGVSIVYI